MGVFLFLGADSVLAVEIGRFGRLLFIVDLVLVEKEREREEENF